MNMNSRTVGRFGALMMGLSMGVSATASAAEAPPRQRYVEARQAIGVSAPDDALAASQRPGTDAFGAQAYLGAAPWICSPSGFGHRSKCFRRASLRAKGR
jgi:hypothetical protein